MSESEGVSRRFDPRFSPAVQPGYDPQVHREVPPSAPLREEPSRDWPETRLEAPGTRRDEPDGADEFSLFALPGDRAVDPDEVIVEEPEPTPWWRRVNPWFIALWAIGLIFLLGGVWLVTVIDELNRNPPQGDGGYFPSLIFQMLWIGVPMLMVLGLATLTAPVVIMAARWRR
jgi:hypothetical protein